MAKEIGDFDSTVGGFLMENGFYVVEGVVRVHFVPAMQSMRHGWKMKEIVDVHGMLCCLMMRPSGGFESWARRHAKL